MEKKHRDLVAELYSWSDKVLGIVKPHLQGVLVPPINLGASYANILAGSLGPLALTKLQTLIFFIHSLRILTLEEIRRSPRFLVLSLEVDYLVLEVVQRELLWKKIAVNPKIVRLKM